MTSNLAVLSDVCEVNPTAGRKPDPDSLCSFVRMESVDDWSASIVRRETRQVCEVSKGYTPFQDGDVLVAKITPCMENGKCALARNLTNGIGYGSTEFHVLRAGDNELPEWLYYFWRYPQTRKEARRFMRGSAGQQRVPGELFDAMQIPLPDLPLQRRIAGILDKADRLRRMRRYALELSDQFLPALFLRMFGDPASNPKGWEKIPLGNVVAVNPALGREFGPNELVSFVAMADVDEVAGEIARAEDRPYRHVAVGYTPFMDGDVLFAKITPCMENGKAAIASALTGGHGFGSTEFHVLRVGPRVRREWLFSYVRLPWFRRLAKASFTGTAGQQRVPDGFLRHHELFLPPAGLEGEYVRAFGQHAQTRAFHREALRQAEHLFQSLLNQYFGEDGVD